MLPSQPLTVFVHIQIPSSWPFVPKRGGVCPSCTTYWSDIGPVCLALATSCPFCGSTLVAVDAAGTLRVPTALQEEQVAKFVEQVSSYLSSGVAIDLQRLPEIALTRLSRSLIPTVYVYVVVKSKAFDNSDAMDGGDVSFKLTTTRGGRSASNSSLSKETHER